ncbi:FAD-dependent oxidoreductase [Ramlibacter henchirensis]|uniref:FAD-dependent oxidoreductase n=1 Tax=Ramlibacter henchirensis TaxID=204072 RepID=A0A4Z0BM97_9BURK|nr:hydroxysqualene dehydroxylase HpnE [Ramlibacter henchirensis]TFZ00423.1 FAD-dependent oxidoreductase [Ramlibacter henchirensis]
MKVAIVGAGWAGLAAAVRATRDGHRVVVHEATRQLGGRARSLALKLPEGGEALLDNGQHIMIGAYTETLALMREVGIVPAQVLHRLPLTLRFPDGRGLGLPDWPSPLDAAWGILTASGWSWRDKLSLLRHAAGWQLRRFQCDDRMTVRQLCRGLPRAVMRELVEPLCVAALNTSAERASAAVFLRVLRDGLFGPARNGWGASNLLIPRVDLGQVFPEQAAEWLQARGAELRLGSRVQTLRRHGGGWALDAEPFDAVLLACPAWEAERLVAASDAGARAWLTSTGALTHEGIATVYATGGPALPLPMLALDSGAGAPAQFVFDRAQLGGPSDVLAFVVSASEGDARTIEQQVIAQAASLGWQVQPIKTVVEKRATFACLPGLSRPPIEVAPGLLACGDYVDGPYPATIEGAVRSAIAAADRLRPTVRTAASAS